MLGQFEERPRGLRGERLGFETTARGFEGSVGSRRRGTALRARRSASARRGLRGWPTRSVFEVAFEMTAKARHAGFEGGFAGRVAWADSARPTDPC